MLSFEDIEHIDELVCDQCGHLQKHLIEIEGKLDMLRMLILSSPSFASLVRTAQFGSKRKKEDIESQI